VTERVDIITLYVPWILVWKMPYSEMHCQQC